MIQKLYPQLCDDSMAPIINGKTFGKLWKHDVRNAQQGMQRRGEIKRNQATGVWDLV